MLAASTIGFYRSVERRADLVAGGRDVDGAEPHHLLFLPTDDTIVFAATSRGLFRSRDRGVTVRAWHKRVPFSRTHRPHLARVWAILARERLRHRRAPQRRRRRHLRRLIADGLVTERAWTLAVDPSAPDRVFAATPSGGLHLLRQAATCTRPGIPGGDRLQPGTAWTCTP